MIQKHLVAALMVVSLSSAVSAEDAKNDAFEGVWLPASAELAGNKFPDQILKTIRLEVKDDQYTTAVGPALDKGACKRDTKTSPKRVEIIGSEGPNKGKTILAIYERKGDALTICYDLSGQNYPAEFKTAAGTKLYLVEYKLQKP